MKSVGRYGGTETKKAQSVTALFRYFRGAKETRTPDPLHAMQMLYQLSYSPVSSAN
jgi:hypothetical protein